MNDLTKTKIICKNTPLNITKQGEWYLYTLRLIYLRLFKNANLMMAAKVWKIRFQKPFKKEIKIYIIYTVLIYLTLQMDGKGYNCCGIKSKRLMEKDYKNSVQKFSSKNTFFVFDWCIKMAKQYPALPLIGKSTKILALIGMNKSEF